MTDRYAVIGHPVEHSLSPEIHAAFAAQTGQLMEYGLLPAPLDGFADTVSAFFGVTDRTAATAPAVQNPVPGRGLNVTVPFKEEAWRWVDEHDRAAALAGAVNTILPTPGETSLDKKPARFLGCNTDGPGLVADLTRHLKWPLQGQKVLIAGAGGAVRGVLGALLDAGVGEIIITNRTVARARQLVLDLEQLQAIPASARLQACDMDKLSGGFDLVINGTSAGLVGDVPALPPATVSGARCYDMVYGHTTPFCKWAQARGAAAVSDGLGMLVEQAAVAFELWRGIRPDGAPVLRALRQARAILR